MSQIRREYKKMTMAKKRRFLSKLFWNCFSNGNKKVVEEDGEKVNFLLIKKPFSNLDLKLRSETELEMNRRIAFFLKELKRFHQKLYDKNPEKAKLKVEKNVKKNVFIDFLS